MTALFVGIAHNAENMWRNDAPGTLRHWNHRALRFQKASPSKRTSRCLLVNEQQVGIIAS